jgi:hypothetical protein
MQSIFTVVLVNATTKNYEEMGCNTQKRIRTFTSQVAQRYYEGMTLDFARKAMDL